MSVIAQLVLFRDRTQGLLLEEKEAGVDQFYKLGKVVELHGLALCALFAKIVHT